MKRLLVVPVVMMFILSAFVPAASADTPNVVFMGQAQSNALDLSLPLLNILPNLGSILGGLVGGVGNLTKGITVGHVENVFEGLNNASSQGLAVGVCSLLGNNLLSLPSVQGNLPGNLPGLGNLPLLGGLPCTGQDQVESASAGNNGSTTQSCGTGLNLAILVIKTACADSYSTIQGGRPVSANHAGVAEIDVSLLPNILGTTGLNSLLGSLGLGNLTGGGGGGVPAVGDLPLLGPLVQTLLGGLNLGNLLGGTLGGNAAQSPDLLGSLTGLLKNILGNAGNLLSLSIGTGSSLLTANGAASQDTSAAAGATIGLLGNLIKITVGAANSAVVWDDATGQATADASPAVAHVTIGNPLDLGGAPLLDLPISLPSLSGLLGGLLGSSTDSAGDLTLLGGTPLQTVIKVATATPHATGRNVTASSNGVAIDALEGLGASALGAFDGGIRINLASSSASVAGDILKVQAAAPSLPITGGPTFVFLAGAAFMAVAAGHVLRKSRRIRAGAKA